MELTRGRNNPPMHQGDDQQHQQDESTLLCSQCAREITDVKVSKSISGSHEHTFFNPSGLLFELRCFSKAPGCFIQGEPSDSFSWFAGYSWQAAFCKTCHIQLGWCFLADTATHSFWALIRNKLI